MITASHNPKEYNGMKSLAHSGEPYNLKKYGPAMVEIMQTLDQNTDVFREYFDPNIDNIYGKAVNTRKEVRDVTEDWTSHILSFIGKEIDFSKYRIVADGGNGVAGVFMNNLAEKAGFTLIPLYLEPDGNFPNHHPNPILAKNREEARSIILS